ncbi:inositol polyphosphate 5-phosphatase OCRL-like [Anneissia japonica]|uniref:inositol polyphosphate 5-phosphatase OCRL-like n=1 Tax=Anneissia japonica TaxID=1529436 RepID=UPI0014257302|nr:inositol polyphosphate 5-phosphatase OCRL-like [Anneissia japonica]
MELTSAVQQLLNAGEGIVCKAALDSILVQESTWERKHTVLAIVKYISNEEDAFFVFTHNGNVNSGLDLRICNAIPIKGHFKYSYHVESKEAGSYIPMQISTNNLQLNFEVIYNQRTSGFVAQMKESTLNSISKITRGISPQFSWLSKYVNQVGRTPQLSTDHVTQNQESNVQTSATAVGAQSSQQHRTNPFVQPNVYSPPLQTNARPTSYVNPHASSHPSHNPYVNVPVDPLTRHSHVGSHPLRRHHAIRDPRTASLIDFDINSSAYAELDLSGNRGSTFTSYVDKNGSAFQENQGNSSFYLTSGGTASSSTQKAQPLVGFEDNFLDLSINRSSSSNTSLSTTSTESPYEYKSLDSFENDAGYAKLKPIVKPAGVREEILKRRESEYTYPHPFKLFVGTWNVNGQNAVELLTPWLAQSKSAPDMYVVGFQELDLSKEAFLFNDSPREEEWFKAVEAALHKSATYRKIKLIRLVGMMLIAFVQERHHPFVSNVMAETVGTGIMGKMGNKGGVAIRFEFHNTSFCFVNTHLAAHVEEFERRNQDFHDICQRMMFEREGKTALSVFHHDKLIWLGDLNYRIDYYDSETVKAYIQKGDYDILLQNDQLNHQRKQKKVFTGFNEGHIKFPPTYKYDTGTDRWDSSEKQRAPAWCDRILYKGNEIMQLDYSYHKALKLSDHKPVSSNFEIVVKVIDEKKYRDVVEEEIRNQDRVENEALPQVTLENNQLEFENVKFMEPRTKKVSLANTGQTGVHFKFVNKLEDKHFCKPWLKVEPSEAYFLPGDLVELTVRILVDKNTAAALNCGEDKIEDILVLHLENGKDYYITINGNYIASCFGSSIEALTRMHCPIRDMDPKDVTALEQGKSDFDSVQKFDIPKEIWMIVDHLFRNGLKQEDLFRQEGLKNEILDIKDCLDLGIPEEIPGSIHSVAESLMLFLESLREPVIPFKYYQKCLDSSNNFVLCKQVMGMIPTSHKNVFKYLTAFIRELLFNSDENKLDAKTLSTMFGSLFLRTQNASQLEKSGRTSLSVARKKASFVYQFLINEYDD